MQSMTKRKLNRMQPKAKADSHYSELGTTRSLNEALLGLIEVDDMPNRFEVLNNARCHDRSENLQKDEITHIRLDIFVLKVEGMLPDVNANDRGVCYIIHLFKQDNRVTWTRNPLRRGSWLAVVTISSF